MRRLGLWVATRLPNFGDVEELIPAGQTLTAQIASALQSADAHAERVANERAARELAIAGEIQATFLPRELAGLPGWEIAASLEPARETSGDFYGHHPTGGWAAGDRRGGCRR